MLLRTAEISDIPKIMQLLARVVPAMIAEGNFQWDSTYPNVQVFENDIALNQLWIAEKGGVIAGMAAITMDQEPEYAHVGWNITEKAIVIHRLAVDAAFRRQGVAVSLLMQAENEAIKRGITVLRVDTNISNTATQQLFPKLGYHFAGEIGLSFRPNLKFYCYEKRLT